MVLGYNQSRPKEENYQDFIGKFAKGLEEFDSLSLMIYGSFVRGDYVPGRSDIDAVLTFPHDVVIDKKYLNEISLILYESLKGNNLQFQVTPTDITIMRDGRFNSFNPLFKNYFFEEGKVITGPDYRKQFRFEISTYFDQESVRFNLRKSRQGLLFAEYDKSENYELFLMKFNKTLDAVSRGSKQLLYFVDEKLRKSRFSALEDISNIFPNLNVDPLERIKHLYHNLEELDELYLPKNHAELMKIWNSSVTFFEEIIREYIRKFPIPQQ